jgi:phosphoribosylformylglycinamidine synthase I
MKEVQDFAKKGGWILGICNGFQILTEAKLLPGVLLKNQSCRFVCTNQRLRLKSNKFLKNTTSTSISPEEIFSMPIAHGDGRYYAEDSVIHKLIDTESIVFTYEEENPNGSVKDIAGICDSTGRIVGMMPHPERAVYGSQTTYSEDGARFLKTWLERI